MNSDSLGGIAVAVIGLLLVCGALADIVPMLRVKSRGECKKGLVVGTEGEGVPVVKYEVAGHEFQILSAGGDAYQIGDEVSVYYFPNCPEKGRTVLSRRQVVMLWIIVAVGIVLTVGGTAAALA